jgi:uncharacterized membrane protein YhfC
MFLFRISIRLISGLVMIGMAIALGALLRRCLDCKWRFFRMGAVCFVASQVFHIPFNLFVLQPLVKTKILGLDLQDGLQGLNLAILAVLYGLSAGVFEEVSRWFLYRYWIVPSFSSHTTSIMLGAGHGGCEAILVGIAAILALAQMILALRSVDNLSDIIREDQLEQVEHVISDYWALPWYGVLMGPLERVITMTAHMSLSILVWQGFVRQSSGLWLVAAIAFHSAIDAVSIFALLTWNRYVVEIILAFTFFPCSLCILFYIEDRSQFLPLTQNDETVLPLDETILPPEEYTALSYQGAKPRIDCSLSMG